MGMHIRAIKAEKAFSICFTVNPPHPTKDALRSVARYQSTETPLVVLKTESRPAESLYLTAALRRARVSQTEDGSYFGEIPELQGCWAEGASEDEALEELASVVEGWLETRQSRGLEIPTIDGICLTRDTLGAAS